MDRLTQEQVEELAYGATCPVTGNLRDALQAAFRLGLAQNAERVTEAIQERQQAQCDYAKALSRRADIRAKARALLDADDAPVDRDSLTRRIETRDALRACLEEKQ